MIKSDINGIFPTPIYISKLNRKLTIKELLFVDKNKLNTYKNEGNTTSSNSYVLNNKELKDLKIELNLRIQDYFDKIICLENKKIKPYITQSWLNFTKINEYHHKHRHSNSLVSGVFYINCHEELDKIKFFNDRYQTIKPEVKDWNIWNSETWWFSVKTGDIILFPSTLDHMVETKKEDNTRISLAFNVFVKGKIGNKKNLNELFL
jgi:uncharacterized protein (TIGR02466 family)